MTEIEKALLDALQSLQSEHEQQLSSFAETLQSMRMANARVGACCCKRLATLSVVEHIPRCGQQVETKAQKNVAGDVQYAEMRVALFAQQGGPQVTRGVGEQIQIRELGLKPARYQINRQREAIHLYEQGNYEGCECAKRPPVTGRCRLEKAERKHDEDR